MRSIYPAALYVVFHFAGPCLAAGEVTHQLVVLNGEPAPGSTTTFLRFSNPVISATGDVAFQANLAGPTVEVVPHGIWAGSRGMLRPLAIAGQSAPDMNGGRFRTPGWPLILTTDGGSLFYAQLLEGGGVTSNNDYGIWGGVSREIELVARRPDPAPGLPAGVNFNLFFAQPHASGLMGFSGSLDSPGVDETNGSAAWIGPIGPAGALRLVARGGDEAPGVPGGARFTSVGTPSVNASGQIVMQATVAALEPSARYLEGIWAGAPDHLRVVALGGAPAPAAPPRRFAYFSPPRLNNAGHVAFAGYLAADSDEERLNNVGIWSGEAMADGVWPIALEGQQAAGFGSGVVFRGSVPGDFIGYDPFGNPTLGGGGHVAFAGTVFGGEVDFYHNDGVWVSDAAGQSRGLRLVAREGARPPGMPEGTEFSGIFFGDDLIRAFENPLLNASGQVAFEATTRGPMGDMGRGIWATDGSGELHLIAHTGQEYLDPEGNSRQIEVLKLNPGGSSEDGYLSAFNDAGELAYAARFGDGSEGVFVATIVPEPSIGLFWLVFLFCGSHGSRRER